MGSAQLLALGKLVRSTYRSSLVNLTSFNSNHDIPQSSSLKVVAYSTRYRRTFQSLFAFLYGLLGPRQIIPSTTIHESQSIAFCFKHCSCKAADRLKKAANKKFKPNQLGKLTWFWINTMFNNFIRVIAKNCIFSKRNHDKISCATKLGARNGKIQESW